MGLFSRCGSILAASISREVYWRQQVSAIAAKVFLTLKSLHGRSNHADGATLPMECKNVEQELRHVLRSRMDVSIVCRASSKSVEVETVRNGRGDGEHKSSEGFRVFSYGEEPVQHIEGRIFWEVKNCGCSSSEIADVKETHYRGLDSDLDQRTGCLHGQIEKDPQVRVFTCGEEVMQGSIGALVPSTDCGPNSMEIGIVNEVDLKRVDSNVEQNAEYELKGNVESAKTVSRADEIVDESSGNSASSNKSKVIREESKGATPTDQIEPVQSNEMNTALNNLPSNCGDPEGDSLYPVPLSPLSGEVAKSIEYERAMVAETAMKSGPAITRSGVLFEDEWLIVINKPCGMYCEHVLATVPSLLTPTNALQARELSLSRLTLRRTVDDKDTSAPHLHMANRLDRDTSGVMVITKCRTAAGKLSNIFTKRQVHKSYIALCRGPRPSWKSLTVDSGHGRSRYGAWRVYSKKDVGRGLPGGSVVRDMTTHLLVMAINKQLVLNEQVVGHSILDKLKDIEYVVTAGDEGSSGILGQSPYENLNTYSEDSSHDSQVSTENDEVVIRAIPLTGRTHQIRLHCRFVGFPLRGDVKYGGPHFLNGVRYDHHALHAESLSFRHPFTFEELHFVAPLPEWATDAGVLPLV